MEEAKGNGYSPLKAVLLVVLRVFAIPESPYSSTVKINLCGSHHSYVTPASSRTSRCIVVMIFQTAFLSFLLSSRVAVSAGDVEQQSTNIDERIKSLKTKLHDQLSIPTSLSAKIEKFNKLRVNTSAVNLETTSFDETLTNLRGLRMRDNFLSMTTYSDSQCLVVTQQYGSLVNYCMNEQASADAPNVKRSYLTKVNKKQNLVVEIEYDGYDCRVWCI